VFKKDKRVFSGKVVDTLIGAETIMTGEIQSKGIVRIEGYFKGMISTKSDVVIGEKAVVAGDITCMNASIAGKLEGNIEAEKMVDIYASGVLLGDIIVGRLMIENGAYFLGKCTMREMDEKKSEDLKRFSWSKAKSEDTPEKPPVDKPTSDKPIPAGQNRNVMKK